MAVSRATPELEKVLPLPLLLHDFSDPGQVVGDAGVDPGWGVVAEGNNALCHFITHQGPTRISLGRDEMDFRLNLFSVVTGFSLVPPCPVAPSLSHIPPSCPELSWGSTPGAVQGLWGCQAIQRASPHGNCHQMLVTCPGSWLCPCQQQLLLPEKPECPPHTWLESFSWWKLPAQIMPE